MDSAFDMPVVGLMDFFTKFPWLVFNHTASVTTLCIATHGKRRPIADRGNKMLGADYCLARAEYLRMLMLTASNPSSELRLRALVEKYRALAERAKREVGSRTSIDVAA